jgi:hypothetical protein
MERINLIEQIRQKADNSGYLAELATKDAFLLGEVLEGIRSREAAVKYKCIKILRIISAKSPAVLYPYFDMFAGLLDGTNNILKWNAIDIIGNLTAADTENKFGPLFDKYYGLMEEGSLITAAHVVESSPVIIKYRPELKDRITAILFNIDRISLPSEECRDILRGKVIFAFSRYADISQNKAGMLEFASKLVQRRVIRKATRKKAERFVKKYSG